MPAPFRVVIPARFASTRLPAKALADIAGRPMVVRVAEAALRACGERANIWVATDHDDIRQAVESHGFQALMTRADHPSGTDRIAEATRLLGWDDDEIVVNVQGDEPLVEPELVRAVATTLAQDGVAAMATASHAIVEPADFFNPNVVKVITRADGCALYFSRAPIPWDRDGFRGGERTLDTGLPAQRHIGLYAYRVAFLRRYADMEPSPLERWEALEQLRVLWNGEAIRVVKWARPPAPGVDTAEDLLRVRDYFVRRSDQSGGCD